MSRSPAELISLFHEQIQSKIPDIIISDDEEKNLIEALQKPNDQTSYYEMLGVNRNATLTEIKTAFRTASLKCHPDKLNSLPENQKQSTEKFFKQINEAYQILSDTQGRQAYHAKTLSYQRTSDAAASAPAQQQKTQLSCFDLLIQKYKIDPALSNEFISTHTNLDHLFIELGSLKQATPATLFFIAHSTTEIKSINEIKDILIEKRQLELLRRKSRVTENSNPLTTQFNDDLFLPRTSIEKELCHQKFSNYLLHGDRINPCYRATEFFQNTFSTLIADAEKLLTLSTHDFPKNNIDLYGNEISNWIETLSRSIMRFYGQINIPTLQTTSPHEALKSLINFFQATDPWKSHDTVNQNFFSLFSPEISILAHRASISMSTLVMQADYLCELARGLEKRLTLLETPEPGHYRTQATPKPASPTRVYSPLKNTPSSKDTGSISLLDRSVKSIFDALKENDELQNARKHLLEWSAAFSIPEDHYSKSKIEYIQGKIAHNHLIITHALQTISLISQLNITPENVIKDYGFIALKSVILSAITNYQTINATKTFVKKTGLARASKLKTDIETIQLISKPTLFQTIAEHLNRTEGSGVFATKGNLNAESLDTFILNAIRTNPAAQAALNITPKEMIQLDNQKLRDLIIQKIDSMKLPNASPDATSPHPNQSK